MVINKEEIKKQIDRVLMYSQYLNTDPETNDLFNNWLTNKMPFITAMGGLIYECPEKVSFSLSEEERMKKVKTFAGNVADFFGYEELGKFILEQKDGFYENLSKFDYKNENGLCIKKGTKLVKSFKHFIKNKNTLTYLQNEASKIIQEDRVEGILCFSVHPLDYLSMSENVHNWRSCHALDGEYRAGNLSYMQDATTVVCYLKADGEYKLPNFPADVLWNSKKWRVLLYFSNDGNLIFSGKQYPFSADNFFNKIIKEYLPKSNLIKSEDYWTEWETTIKNAFENKEYTFPFKLGENFIPHSNGFFRLSDVVYNAIDSQQYNDILLSSSYDPLYSLKMNKAEYFNFYDPCITEKTSIEVGASVKCISCGRPMGDGVGNETMMCSYCDPKYDDFDNDYYYCDCCGRRIYYDETYDLEGETLCEECYDNLTARCHQCGEDYFRYNLTLNLEDEEYYCSECYNETKESAKYGS